MRTSDIMPDLCGLGLILVGILLCSVCFAGEKRPGAALPADMAWSGTGVSVMQGSNGPPLTVRFEKQGKKDAVSTLSTSWEPMDFRKADALEIDFSVNRPISSIRIVLTDKDGVGADNSVADVLSLTKLDPGRTYHLVWPYQDKPGWVRYGRTRMRWEAITGVSLYVGEADLDEPLELTLASLKLKTFEELQKEGVKIPPRVIGDEETHYMLQRYFVDRATDLTAKAHKKWAPKLFKLEQENIRKALLKTFLLPPDEGPSEATSLGFVEIDGVKVEKRLVKTRPGVYVTCSVYFPPNLQGKAPGLMIMPGHGNMEWEAGIQELGLAFAKAGFVSYFVQPFGQGQRGFNPMRNELLSNMSTGILIAAGQSLLGMIIDERRRVLDDMQSRPEIDPERLAITGVSMGGTHSLWLGAADPRVKIAIADAAAYFWRPQYAYCHHSIADLIVGQFTVGDEELIDALIAPRTLVRIHPNSESPMPLEVAERFREGWLTYETMMKEKPLSAREALAEHYSFTVPIYREFGVERELAIEIVPGAHEYNKRMREVAVGWMNHVFKGSAIGLMPEEPPLDPIPYKPVERLLEAKSKLFCWPDGKRPADYLDPGQYAARVISEKVKLLPDAPSSARNWKTMKRNILAGVRSCVGTDFRKFSTRATNGGVTDLPDRTLTRLIVEPEKGIKVPVLIVSPKKPGAAARVVIYLSPDGIASAFVSPRLDALIKRGWTAALVDLRGLGETRMVSESGSYMGFRDYDLCNSSLRLGETPAGLWARDLSAVLAALRRRDELKDAPFSIRAEKETGFAAVLVAATAPDIESIALEGFFASYVSPRGYGGLYIFRDENHKPVSPQPTQSYGSAALWIPNILDYADIPQLLSLCAPKRLLLLAPIAADGNPDGGATGYAWTHRAYSYESPGGFAAIQTLPDESALDWLEGNDFAVTYAAPPHRPSFWPVQSALRKAVGPYVDKPRMAADKAAPRNFTGGGPERRKALLLVGDSEALTPATMKDWTLVSIPAKVDLAALVGLIRGQLNQLVMRNDIDRNHIYLAASGGTSLAATLGAGSDHRVAGLLLIKPGMPPDAPPELVELGLPRLLGLVAPTRVCILGAPDIWAFTRAVYENTFKAGKYFVTLPNTDDPREGTARLTDQPYPKLGHPDWKAYYQKPIIVEPPLPRYVCGRIPEEFTVDGKLDEPFWRDLPRASRFVHITHGERTRYDTIVKLGWNDQGLLTGFRMEEPDVVAREDQNDAPLGGFEQDIEFFLEPDGDGWRYLEIEVNPFNKTYDTHTSWAGAYSAFCRDRLRGVRTAVYVDGTLNDPRPDRGWSVEIYIPWADLADFAGLMNLPPKPGDTWRMNMFRMAYSRPIVNGKPVRVGQSEDQYWVWSALGYPTIHLPERFGFLEFGGE